MLHVIAARKPKGQEGLERILWWTDQFASLSCYRAALQQQAKESAVVDDFVRELDAALERMLGNAFRGRVSDDDQQAAVATFRATVDGTYAEGLSRAERRKLLSFALKRLWTLESPV